MKESNQSITPENNNNNEMANLFNILSGNTDTEEKSTSDDDSKDKEEDTITENFKEIETSFQAKDKELEILQQVFGKSDIDKLGERVEILEKEYRKMEKKYQTLESNYQKLDEKLDNIYQLLNAKMPAIFSEVLNNKLKDFKREIIIELGIVVDKSVAENSQQEQNLSIKVVGLKKDDQN